MTRLLLFLAAVLVAWPAAAWNACGAFASAELAEPVGLRPGGYREVCHDTAGTTDSTLLSVSAMAHFQIHMDPDVASTGTGCEVQIYQCAIGTASTAGCEKLLGDTDGDGVDDDVTLNGTAMRHGFKWETASMIYVDVTANTGSTNCRTRVTGYE